MFKVAVTTFGCKVNQCESAGIAEAMAARGMTLVPFEEEADCYIVNTCTVTGQDRLPVPPAHPPGDPEKPGGGRPRDRLLRPESAGGDRPDSRCPDRRRKRGKVAHLPELIRGTGRGKRAAGPGRRHPEAKKGSPLSGQPSFPGHTRAFLKIQDGCDAFCSYCIVPRARGGSRSPPACRGRWRGSPSLAGRGYREVVLSGIHLGAYGRDLVPATDLTAVVRRIVDERPIERLRLSSIEPREVTDELLSLIGSSGIVCRHLHIPLQSGDDGILAAMNRDYDAAFFRDLIRKILATIPGIAIGIDVMVGFPGETEAAFANTLRLVEELPFAYLHVFPFSRRPGTPAAAMPGQVPEADKKQRVERLRTVGAEKRRAFAEKFIGAPLTILIEGKKDKSTGFFVGFSDNYIPVACRGAADANRIVSALPGSFRNGRLIAEVIHE